MKKTNTLWLSILFMIFPLSAWSQTTELYVETFEPESTQKTAILNVATAEVLPHGIPSLGIFFHFVDDPVQLRREDTDETIRLLDDQLKTEFSFGLGLFEYLDLGVTVPLTAYQKGDSLKEYNNNEDSVTSFSFADPRVSLKASFFPERLAGFGLAVKATTYIPLGNRTFHTDGDFRFEPELIADWQNEDFQVALNASYQVRSEKILRNVGADDAFKFGVGTQYRVIKPMALFATFTGAFYLADGRNPDNLNVATSNSFGKPMEIDGGLRFDFAGDWILNMGGGVGVSSGIGSPDFRVFAGIEHVAFPSGFGGIGAQGESIGGDGENQENKDTDGDGVFDATDKCPNESEDMDAFEDEDGCPDPDNDSDGILDAEDECPGLSGIPEKRGCPFVDSDKDGIDDDIDSCPQEAEDLDKFEDDDGCPDLDNDGDGIADVDDKCPLKAEVINGKDDEDGCPDESESKIRVTKNQIEIFEMVYFDSNKSTIQERSLNILNQVRSVLRANPQIKRIQIEGHTDNRGSAESNLSLSQRRAEAVVKFLVDKGIDKSRLKPKGYGEARPVADNKDKAGRTENRRVEFFILEVKSK